MARKATLAARKAEATARAQVAVERAGIVQLVTESYQNGTALNSATALMGGEGPQGLMNRYAVVQSAGDSMQAHYDTYRQLSAAAATATTKATQAQQHQTALTTDAKKLAVAAGQAADAAAAETTQIATQRQQLVQALAKAQNISVQLATQRQKALAAIAAQQAAAALKQHQLELQAKAHQAALAAQKAKQEAAQQSAGSTSGPSLPPVVSAPVPVANPAPNQSVAVQRAIAYARAQIGKPYQWGAAGPSTFDCSGLTMQAWARGGIALGHYTGAQFDQSTIISMADARPGDLLFFSSDGTVAGIHHVALYIGGGQYIEAPHTGAFVRISSLSSWYPDFVGRPRG